MKKNKIGECASLVMGALHCESRSWEELLQSTGLAPLELACAIGWLAREDMVNIRMDRGRIAFEAYHEHYY